MERALSRQQQDLMNGSCLEILKCVKDCAIGKARQKNTNKIWSQGSRTPGERLYIDISSIKGERLYIDIRSIKGESFGDSRFWALIVDDFTDYFWSNRRDP